ncbi:SipW-dependent-type signal peptide-containing protein [Halobacteriaceae archaeon GCM10025711]
MSRKIELSRRNLLATMGAIGAGAALGGAGTMALFNDEEVFEDNRLVAGELDLKVDWQQEYHGAMDADVYGTAGRPYVNAFPDDDGDGKQDPIRSRDWLAQKHYLQSWKSLSTGHNEGGSGHREVERLFREQFADVPNDVPAPLIDLRDVKPGDSGEVTFSLHIFDNPAYMWLFGDLKENLENGETEPESLVDETDGGDLADAIMARLWYDDGDNVYQDGETVFAEGTLADVLDDLGSGIALDAEAETQGRQCYPNSTTQYVAFEWWLPLETGNEVQSDSVSFDLRFYAEQCRHNDGVTELQADVGSGDYSQTSYDRKLGMALRYGNSHYEDGSIGRAPYEQEIHPSTSGYGQNFRYESGTTYNFLATLEPGTETELAVFGDDLGRSVGDSNLATGSYTTDATGGPTEGELALTVKAQSANLSTGDSVTIEDVKVNGVSVSPGSLTATKGGTELQYMALSGLDFGNPVSVTGKLTFAVDEANLPATDPHDVLTAVGIDWR